MLAHSFPHQGKVNLYRPRVHQGSPQGPKRLEVILFDWTGFSIENCVFFLKKESTFLGQPPLFKDAQPLKRAAIP